MDNMEHQQKRFRTGGLYYVKQSKHETGAGSVLDKDNLHDRLIVPSGRGEARQHGKS